MTLERAPKAVAQFEACHKRLLAGIDALKTKMPGVSESDIEDLAAKLGGLDKVEALARAMPDQPTMTEIIAALGGAEAFGTFTAQTLGGNVDALAMLADKGCKRDPAALADIATKFADEPETLGNMLSEGGLGNHPEAFAQVFADGCNGNADDLLAFCKTFDSPAKRAALGDALDEGGLGQAPAALASLASENNGELLLKVAQDADKTALGDLLLTGGMGGEPPDHPDTLRAVLTDALGGDPKRLKDLHDAFPHDGSDMSEMQAFFQAMNGKSLGGEAMAGKRMDTLMKAFDRREGPLSSDQLAAKLYDPYFVKVTEAATDARASDESGAGTIDHAAKAIADRAALPKGQIADAMMQALPEEAGVGLLAQLTADPEAQKQLEQAQVRLDLAGINDAALREDTEERAADEEVSEATRAAIAKTDELRVALAGKLDGGTPKDVDDLTRAAEVCVDAARAEPGADLRVAALDSAKLAMATAREALQRQAAQMLTTLGDAGDQQSALAATGRMAAQAENDPTASKGEKAAMLAAVGAAGDALGAKALANQAADTGTLAGKVAAACAERLGKPVDSPEVINELARLKKVAQEAAKMAEGLTKALKVAPVPIDPGLLVQAGRVAQDAVQAALATADEPAMKAALAAGKALADAVAKGASGMAASAEIAQAFASDKAKPAVLALNDIDAIKAALLRDKAAATGPTPDIDTKLDGLQGASAQASTSALAAAELDRIDGMDTGDLTASAEWAAQRQAALDGVDYEVAKDAANDLARTAATAAGDAADALAGKPAPIDDTLIKAASKAAQEAAQAALGAVDPVVRDKAVSDGQRAALAAAKALGDNAAHQLAARSSASKGTARASVNASRGPADSFATDPVAGRAALGGAMKDALRDLGEAAASQLMDLASEDSGVQDARAAAAKAAAAADRPGASQLKQLLSIKADCAAQGVLARLATARAGGAVTGLALVPPPTWPPALVSPPPPPHYVQATTPATPTEADMQAATLLCEAAITAGTKWQSSATQYRDAAREFLKLAGKTPEPKRTTAEKDDFAKIDSMTDGATGAPKELADAKTALAGMNTTTSMLETKAQALMHAVQIARIKFNPPGDQFDSANTSFDAADANLENAAGFAAIIGTRAFKTVGLPDGSKETFGPASRDSLMTTGANMAKAPLPGDFEDPDAPPPPPPRPRLAMSNNADITGHADCKLDLEHMCERHCRSHFSFAPGELMHEEDVLACAMLLARTKKVNKAASNGAATEFYSQDEKAIKKMGSGKTTTLWPEGASADDIAAAATLALVKLKAFHTGSGTFASFVFSQTGRRFSKILPGVRIGAKMLSVSLGVSTASATGPVRVVMFYPMGEESLTVVDCHKLKAALGM
jgi:hypothetical protein